MSMSMSPPIKMEEAEEAPRDEASWNVLVVDADESSLLALEQVLQDCKHTVIKCKESKECMQMLRENAFDMVFIDDNVSGMGGFQLCRLVREETRIPIILMSSKSSNVFNVDTVQKALDHGASDFLLKPIETETITKMDLNALRARPSSLNRGALMKPSHEAFPLVKRERSADSVVEINLPPPRKKRVIWTTELHAKFVAAAEKDGIENTVPKKIMELMDVPDITRENVASHLQKYRQYLKKKQGNTTKEQVHSTRPPKRNPNKDVIPHPTVDEFTVESQPARFMVESQQSGFMFESQPSGFMFESQPSGFTVESQMNAFASSCSCSTLVTSDVNQFSGLYITNQQYDHCDGFADFADANNPFLQQQDQFMSRLSALYSVHQPFPPQYIQDPSEVLGQPMQSSMQGTSMQGVSEVSSMQGTSMQGTSMQGISEVPPMQGMEPGGLSGFSEVPPMQGIETEEVPSTSMQDIELEEICEYYYDMSNIEDPNTSEMNSMHFNYYTPGSNGFYNQAAGSNGSTLTPPSSNGSTQIFYNQAAGSNASTPTPPGSNVSTPIFSNHNQSVATSTFIDNQDVSIPNHWYP